MKTTVLFTCLSAALISAAAFANQPGMTPPANSAQSMSTARSDAEPVAILTAVNDHEVKAAEMALAKKPSAKVAEYARMLHGEHTSNQVKTSELASAQGASTSETPAVAALKAKSKAKREELSKLEGAAFEKAYIDAMVQDHTEVLAKIDDELLPMTTDAELSKHLRDTRTHIAKHLEQAKELAKANAQASR